MLLSAFHQPMTVRRPQAQAIDAPQVAHVRERGSTVGVVSVDPSSPFSRGALLGDRIRLADHFLDPGVYIRSMGTRGHLGGLAEATLQAVLLLDASGKDVLFVETVGAGQSEVEVTSIADTVLLVVNVVEACLPDLFPAWMRIEMVLVALLMCRVVATVFGRRTTS